MDHFRAVELGGGLERVRVGVERVELLREMILGAVRG